MDSSPRRVRLRRVALAFGASAAMVVLIAALVPRSYLANDDIALTEFLRKDMFTPWISPVLARALGLAYRAAPEVPWYGLNLYALMIITGAVLFHTCSELVDHRPGFGRFATLLGAIMISASHAILAIIITWTMVSISAVGTGLAAFVAHAQICQAAGRPASRARAAVYGLLVVAGFALRPEGLTASGVALLPMLGWAALRFARSRHLPHRGAVIALLAPIALLLAIQGRIPQDRGAETTDYAELNKLRGQLSDQAEFGGLDARAPELLARAGWTTEDYRDFVRWLFVDENVYSIDKLKRLVDTGGVPEPITVAASVRQLRDVYDYTAPCVLLFVTMALVGVVLAWLGVIRRWSGLAFSLGYLVVLAGLPVWMSAHQRFPQRLSLSLYTVAALGVFVYLARQVADRPAVPGLRPGRDLRATVAAVAIAAFALPWARHLYRWFDQVRWPREELQAFEDRVAARNGFVYVHIQTGLVDFDPLRAQPRGYDGLEGGWATFSAPWYASLARLGVHRGSELLGAMVDNPGAYVLVPWSGRAGFEEWVQRKVHNPAVRLAFVDAAAQAWDGRPALYRVVTHPMVRGDGEWQALQRHEWRMNLAFPGPPSVADLEFRAVSFAAPYEQHLARLRDPTVEILAPVDGGLRCVVDGDPRDGCTGTGALGQDAGVHIPVNGLHAARFEVALIDPENIVSFHTYARTRTTRSIHWRWELGPDARRYGFAGTFTLVPGYPANRLELTVDTARPDDVRDLDIFISVKPGSHAGFELRRLEVARP